MAHEVRRIRPDEAADAWRLYSVAFGFADQPVRAGFCAHPGRTTWGVFEDGRLIATALDREQRQWFGGRPVPAAGVADVVVAPEQRRGGVGREVLTRLLAGARERGAAISTLFASTPIPYRRLGWEEVGGLTYLAVPASALATVRPDADVVLRPATVDDVPAIQEIYRDWARAGTGLMERSGPQFTATPAELLAAYHGVTVAERAGTVAGYCVWDRVTGADGAGRVTVPDLLATTGGAARTLLSMLGSWASVAPVIALRLGAGDPALLEIPSTLVAVDSRQPWMLRLVDAPAAVAARGWPAHLRGTVDLDLADPVCPWNSGRHRLVLDGGEARLEPGGTGAVRLDPRGLAAWYAGAASPTALRRAGLLEGDPSADALLAAATAGPVPVLHDFF